MSKTNVVGLVLLLCVVGACGGIETGTAQYAVEPPGVTAEQFPNALTDTMLDPWAVKLRISKYDPSLKRPEAAVQRPVKRPPKLATLTTPLPLPERDLVRCGEDLVDIFEDPDHCGGCFAPCATGMCQEGVCVSPPAGH